MGVIQIKVTPGGFWDQFWACARREPTLAWQNAHIAVSRHDLRLALDTGDPDAVTRLRETLEAK